MLGRDHRDGAPRRRASSRWREEERDGPRAAARAGRPRRARSATRRPVPRATADVTIDLSRGGAARRCAATRPRSAGSSATCSTTRSGTPATQVRISLSRDQSRPWCSTSSTTAPGSTRRTATGSSTASTGPTRSTREGTGLGLCDRPHGGRAPPTARVAMLPGAPGRGRALPGRAPDSRTDRAASPRLGCLWQPSAGAGDGAARPSPSPCSRCPCGRSCCSSR